MPARTIVPELPSRLSPKDQTNYQILQRIAALKARKPVAPPALDDFNFDPTEPLRLITPGKPAVDK